MDRRKEKVIILAAESETRTQTGVPSCLLKTDSGFSLLEIQLQTLSLYNIPDENIILVIGAKGPWLNVDVDKLEFSKRIRTICNIDNDISTSKESLRLALLSAELKPNDELLILYSDFLFGTGELDKILSRKGNTVAVRLAKHTNEIALKIFTNQNFPWLVFAGMLKIQRENLEFINWSDSELSLAESLKDQRNISIVDIDAEIDPFSGESSSFDLAGGSYASLRKRNVVRKEVKGKGMEKLINEIDWLDRFSVKFNNIYPSVIERFISEDLVWYEMPHFDLPSLRKQIICMKIDTKSVGRVIEKVLSHLIANLYNNYRGEPSIDFIRRKHFDRVYYRLFEIVNYSQDYRRLICEGDLCINGKSYPSLTSLFTRLLSLEGLERAVMPLGLVDIHGDLHFQNILIDENQDTFILADPRGELNGSDLFYDLGKLWHSFNGLYDLIHTNQFDLSIDLKQRNFNIQFTNPRMIKIYSEIKELIENLVYQLEFPFKGNNFMFKILFNEAMHFCSVSTFHINRYGDETRSMAMYLVGIQLLSDFLELEEIKDFPVLSTPLYYFSDEIEFLDQLKNNKPNVH